MSFSAPRGITRIEGRPLGQRDAGLLLRPGPNGPAFLATKDFDVVYSYNAAESYSPAASVLADRFAGGPGILTPWPTNDPGSRVPGGENCRRCSSSAATTSASRTGRSVSARRPRRRTPTSSRRTACR